MNLSVSHNLRAIVKYIVTAFLMITNSILGMASISLGLFVGLVIVNLFMPNYISMAI